MLAISIEILREFWQLFKRNARVSYDFLSIAPFIGRWLPFAFSVGIISGFIASSMDFLIVNISIILNKFPFLFVIYPYFVGILAAFFSELDLTVAGPGIGYAIYHLRSRAYIAPLGLLFKFISTTLVLAGFFIAGREGPSFYIGTGLGEWLGKIHGFSKKYKPYLAIVGAAAFTGALLKAPLGSAVFAMELERTYNLNYKPLVPSLIASIISYLTFSFFRGKEHFIPINNEVHWDLTVIPYIVSMGLVVSFVIFIYSIFYHTAEQIFKREKNRYKRLLIGIFLASIVIYILAFTISPDILSAPANMKILSYLAQNPIPLWKDILLATGIILATSFTLAAGLPGGLVLPNLLIGISIGNIFGYFFPKYIEVFTIAGMGAALAAGAKTPLAAIIMLTEMTNTDVVIPMASAIIVSYITSFGYHLYKGQITEKPLSLEECRRG
jgi:CIC family chloride channel protein